MQMNPYIYNSPAQAPQTSRDTVGRKIEIAAEKVGTFAGNVYTHARTGLGKVDVTLSRLDLAARSMVDGGLDQVFVREFGSIIGEKLKHAHGCHLSNLGGSVVGTLFITNKRVAFKSQSPVKTGPDNVLVPVDKPGPWVYYKVVIDIYEIKGAYPATNWTNPNEKYIKTVTKDGHEFWFAKFFNFQVVLRNLTEALPTPSYYT